MPVQQIGCVAKTHRDAERCVIASSTHPTGSRPSPAGARPGSTFPLNQGDPPCSFPPWPPGPRQGWAASSDRFWLRELRVSRTFLDNLRLICSVHGYPARRTASTADPDDPLIPQRWVGDPDFPSEWAGTGLTSLKRQRMAFENAYVQCPSLALQACCKRLPRHRLHSRGRLIQRCSTKPLRGGKDCDLARLPTPSTTHAPLLRGPGPARPHPGTKTVRRELENFFADLLRPVFGQRLKSLKFLLLGGRKWRALILAIE